MALSFSKLLPLMSQLAGYVKKGADHYSDLRAAGTVAGPDAVAAYLQEEMKNWNPTPNGCEVLDDPTRAAGSRFLAGIIVNFVGA